MIGTTHMAAGITAGILSGGDPTTVVLTTVGSLLPDIDIGSSKLGRYVKPLAVVLKHRGLTHSLAFLALCFFISKPLGIGVITHLVLDMCNYEGVKLFWPFPNMVRFPLPAHLKSGGILDKLLGLAIFALDFILMSSGISLP